MLQIWFKAEALSLYFYTLLQLWYLPLFTLCEDGEAHFCHRLKCARLTRASLECDSDSLSEQFRQRWSRWGHVLQQVWIPRFVLLQELCWTRVDSQTVTPLDGSTVCRYISGLLATFITIMCVTCVPESAVIVNEGWHMFLQWQFWFSLDQYSE